MEFFTTPNSKNIIATLRIVAIEKSESTFFLILYFHEMKQNIPTYLIRKAKFIAFLEKYLKNTSQKILFLRGKTILIYFTIQV